MIFLSMFNSVLLNMIIQSSFTHRTSVWLSFSSERQKEMLWQIFTCSVYSDQWLSFQNMKDTSCVNYDRMVIFGWTFSVSMKLSSMFNYISLNRWCNFLLKSLVKAAAQQLPWHKCWCWDHIVRACMCVCVCLSQPGFTQSHLTALPLVADVLCPLQPHTGLQRILPRQVCVLLWPA